MHCCADQPLAAAPAVALPGSGGHTRISYLFNHVWHIAALRADCLSRLEHAVCRSNSHKEPLVVPPARPPILSQSCPSSVKGAPLAHASLLAQSCAVAWAYVAASSRRVGTPRSSPGAGSPRQRRRKHGLRRLRLVCGHWLRCRSQLPRRTPANPGLHAAAPSGPRTQLRESAHGAGRPHASLLNSSSGGGVTSCGVSTLAVEPVTYRFLIVRESLSVSAWGQHRTYQMFLSSGYADLRTCG